jgi:hypothetical protein
MGVLGPFRQILDILVKKLTKLSIFWKKDSIFEISVKFPNFLPLLNFLICLKMGDLGPFGPYLDVLVKKRTKLSTFGETN